MRVQHVKRSASARLQRGLSLIELMVALVIGSVLIGGAVYVYLQSRTSYATNETAARLQETARYALSIVEPDVRMSNYWGLVKGASVITNQALQTAASAGAPTSCGPNFARDLQTNLEGTNNTYGLACPVFSGGAVASADTLTVRRAAVCDPDPNNDGNPADSTCPASQAGRLQICSTRLAGRLYSDGSACFAPLAGQINNLSVDAYYVARDSDQRVGLPSLRRFALTSTAGVPVFEPQEIIPGIEDMQIKFGINPTGTVGVATRYVDPGAVPANAQVVAVRIWLLVRADDAEVGFVDGRTYEYGDRLAANGTTPNLNAAGAATKAYAPADGFRRLLVSRTIKVRNALGT